MKSSTTDKIQGAARAAMGSAKKIVGKQIDDQQMQDQGSEEKISGKVQSKVGDIKKVFGK